MAVRYGGKCVECCIPAGERTLDYLEELEWDDDDEDDVIVEPPSREPSRQRSEPMQTDETQRPREASTTRRGEGTPKRGDSSDSDEDQTSVMKTYAEGEVPSSPAKDEEEAACVC